MILIISNKAEKYTTQVENALKRESIQYYRLNLDLDSLKNTYVSDYINDIELSQNENSLLLSTITFVWVKRSNILITHEEEKENGGFSDDINFDLWKKEWTSVIKQIILFLEHQNVDWFDSPVALSKSGLKNFQLRLARKNKFQTPKTLISNDKDTIISFINSNSESIVKLSTQPAFNLNNNIYFIYTNKITISDFIDFEKCINSPLIFQEYINKQYEVRYTFVNGKHFVCKIDSQISSKSQTDWRRYDIKNTPYTQIAPPQDIYQKVELYMNDLNLNYGALDFIIDNNNEWWFLEINAVGQYGWIEQLTGMPITEAIVDYIKQYIH